MSSFSHHSLTYCMCIHRFPFLPLTEKGFFLQAQSTSSPQVETLSFALTQNSAFFFLSFFLPHLHCPLLSVLDSYLNLKELKLKMLFGCTSHIARAQESRVVNGCGVELAKYFQHCRKFYWTVLPQRMCEKEDVPTRLFTE